MAPDTPPAGLASPETASPDAALERLLLEHGLLTPAQLERARRILGRLEEPKPLRDLVVELGWVTCARIDGLLRERRKSISVEEILVEKGLLSARQLGEARAAGPGPGLGRRLVDAGLVTERDWLETWCERHDVPFVAADATLVDPAVLQKISVPWAVRHRAVPMSLQAGRLTVLVDDPERPQVLADLARLFSCAVSVCLTTREKLEETLAAIARGPEEIAAANPFAIQYHQLREQADTDPVTAIVDGLLLRAIREGASDVHIEPMASKLRVRFRIDGSLLGVTEYPVAYAPRIISRVKVLAQADVADHRRHQDGRLCLRHGDQEIDVRASFYVTVFGENVVLRILRKANTLVALDEMGFSPGMLRLLLEEVLEPSTGIVLVTGPTGSGKTTTLYAAVDRLNDTSKKIITCEDPVEYVIEGITQCSVANRQGLTFVDSLRAIVRQDPDIILVGEIRDRESAAMAVQAALTGHKVLSTFHTEDSVGALLRLLDMGIEPFLIASTVTAILAQRLVRRLCPHCSEDYGASPRETRSLGISRDELSAFPLVRGRGCARCHRSGYSGRLGIHELLVMTDGLRDAILQHRPSHELRRLALDAPGFVHLQEDGVVKALRGRTTFAEVLENAPRLQTMRPLGRLVEMYD